MKIDAAVATPPASSVLAALMDASHEAQRDATFFDEVWERCWRRWRPARGLTWMLGAADLNRLITSQRPADTKPPSLGRMHAGKYQHIALGAELRDAELDLLLHAWTQGFTLIVPELHRYWDPAALFAEKLVSQTGLRAEMNVYHTPPLATTFPPHYDTHDVFVLQLFGEKIWRLYPSPTYLPFPEEPFDAAGIDVAMDSHSAELRLMPGDVLYLPRGVIHAARAEGLPSTHMSLGLYPTVWRDVLTADDRWSPMARQALRQGVSPAYRADPVAANAPAPLRRFLPDASRASLIGSASRVGGGGKR